MKIKPKCVCYWDVV